jgi:NAD-dependent dihydropyrimidine dehydrogenase PreA subunit
MKIKRAIIQIDEDKCNGCGACVPSCQEGALAIVDGKARLVKDLYCDGLGACLGHCPTGALTVIEREADPFDQAAAHQHLAVRRAPIPVAPAHAGGCPGSAMRQMKPRPAPAASDAPQPSMLGQWPVQLMLVPPHAPFLRDADLLICADCVPFAFADFHRTYLAGKAVVVGCPKLDDLPHYEEKLTQIFRHAQPRRVTVLRMEVPCCGGIAHAALTARQAAGSNVPVEIHTFGVDGAILRRETHGAPAHAAAF